MRQRIPTRNLGNKYPESSLIKSKIGVGIKKVRLVISDSVRYDRDYVPHQTKIDPSLANNAWESRHNTIRIRRRP
ncbi:MAG: hypothetical protein WDA47_08910 [Bacilli bacterium]